MSMGIGSGNENHGLYDNIAGKWMIVADVNGNVTVNGNSATSSQTYVTVSHPSAVTYYAPTFISRTSTGTTSGNSDLRASDRYYIYDGGSATSGIWLNVGKANYLGGITLHDNSSYYASVRPTALTTNRTTYLPNAAGWLVVAGNGTSTGAGSDTRPIYVSTSGVATGITATAIAYGGTGATTQAAAFTNVVAPGGAMTGPLSWTNSTALPAATSAEYFLTIDAFADGGKTKYITKANAIKSLVGSSAIGSTTKPVYWTGTAFSEIGYSIETSVPSGALFTDEKVSQSETTTSNWRKVLLSYQSGSSGTAITTQKNVVYANAAFEFQPSTGTVKATKFQGPLAGNATTATTLQNARTIQTNLASTSAASFNGSANITPGVTGTLPIANGGTGATTAAAARSNLVAAPAPRYQYANAGTTSYYYFQLDVEASTSNIQITGDMWMTNYTSTSYTTPGRVTFAFMWTSSGAFSSGYYTDAGTGLSSFELVASPANESTGIRTLYLKISHTVKYQHFYITAYANGAVTKNVVLTGTTTAPTIDSEKTLTMVRRGPVFVTGTSSDTKYYLVGVTGANATTGSYHLYKAYNGSGSANTAGVYFNGSSGVLYGAAWNDYAEYRETKEEIKPGCCVKEIGDDTLELTTNRLERGCEIVSDTYGFAIGETNKSKTPIAASGRVLAYPYESREEFASHIGWPVCSGPNGTVSIMTEEEEEKYPSRIIGTISAVPDYEEWGTGNVKVNGRVWIRIR